MKRTNQKHKSLISFGLVLSLVLSVLLVSASAADLRSDSTVTLEDLTSASDTVTMAVVNFESVWGDIEANTDSMTDYIIEAAENGVQFILFPEMAATGYASSNDPANAVYKMAVENAESADGATATYFSGLAKQYDMWICYGASEAIEGDTLHAYNSMFCCAPDGSVVTYQKIHPVEGAWCTPGNTPVILDTQWGGIGLSICYDTYAAPELERYYTAAGCRMILNPTATSRGSVRLEDGTLDTTNWQWYYMDRLESISDRDGVYIASCDLAGKEYDTEGNLLYHFPGGSCILGPGGASEDGKYIKYYAGNPDWQVGGMDYATIDLSLVYSVADDALTAKSTVKDILTSTNFQPELYASWYSDLATDGFAMASAPVLDEAVISVVNFNATWGDLNANLEKMIAYIEEAEAAGTNILVFPEMALQGYCSSSDPETEAYRLAVDQAITCESSYAGTVASYAEDYNMYILFGASEVIPDDVKGDADQAYNSVFCCSPDGSIVSYQKIQPVEGAWCMPGETPVIVETPYGALGISICKDTYSYPELSRYYVAKGCTYIVNPTATSRGGESRWSWYYTTRLESTCDRDKVVVISADLCGTQYDSEGDEHSTFPGGSGVLADLNRAANGSYVSYIAGTGEYEPENVGMYTGTLDLSDSQYSITYGCSIVNFSPALYADWYASLTTASSDSTALIASGYAFSDVTGDRWSAGYIYGLYDSGVIAGYADGTYLPVKDVSRAEFVKLLASAYGADVSGMDTDDFADVSNTSWYSEYVAWAYESGITSGTSATTFSPNAAISREDMAVMISRFAAAFEIELTETVDAISFSDTSFIDGYALAAVAELQKSGLINGIENADGTYSFMPDAFTSREQSAKVINMLLALI